MGSQGQKGEPMRITKQELAERWETEKAEVEKIAGMGFLTPSDNGDYCFMEALVAEMKADQDLPEKLRTVQDARRLGMTGERFEDFKRHTLLEIVGHNKKPYFNTLFDYYMEALNV